MSDNGANRQVLSRDAIFQADDIKTEWVEVPEWGGGVYVRGLTGKQRDAWEISTLEGKGKDRDVNLHNLRAKLVVWSVVDEKGARLFINGDEEMLGTKAASGLQKIFVVAQRLSGLTEDDVQELTGKLGNEQSDGSGSDSPSPSGDVPSRSSSNE